MKTIQLGSISIGGKKPLVLIAGPCVVESRDLILSTAEKIQKIARQHSVEVIFKSSYKKANRTSSSGFVGLGVDEALKILAEVKSILRFSVGSRIYYMPPARLVRL